MVIDFLQVSIVRDNTKSFVKFRRTFNISAHATSRVPTLPRSYAINILQTTIHFKVSDANVSC
jgi:hypothetical protein